jgi:hypothetical protein
LIACLDRGVHQERPILTPGSYEQMWTPAARRDNPPLREEMGLGWNLGHFEGVRTVSHGGAGLGWSALLVFLPERNRGAIILSNEEDAAMHRLTHAVILTMLEQEPHAGSVSLMVPISQAMHQGGIQAARAQHAALRDNPEFFFNEYQLIDLGLNMLNAGKIDESIATLELNTELFPQSTDSYTFLARLYLRKGERAQAEVTVRKSLLLQPEDAEAIAALAKIQEMDQPR